MLSIAGFVGYLLYISATAVITTGPAPMTTNFFVPCFPRAGFLIHVGAFLNVFYAPGSFITTKHIGPLMQNAVGLMVFAGTFAVAFLLNRTRSAARLLSISLLVVGLVGAPLIVAMSYYSAHMYTTIPGRCALTLVPAGLATAVSAVRRKPAEWFVGLSGAVPYLVVLAWMFVVPM